MGHWYFTLWSRHAGLRLGSALLLSALLLSACGKKEHKVSVDEDTPVRDLQKQAQARATEAVAAAPVSTLPTDQRKTCFNCEGHGLVQCRNPRCRAGKVDCPGGCLKLSEGVWTHMDVQGHNSAELWQKFPGPNGGYIAWSSKNLGEVIAIQNGEAVNLGKCQVCGGSTRVSCQVCAGTGKQTCEVCGGRRYVPLAWMPNDNPWVNAQPDLIRLRDGRCLFGRLSQGQDNDRIIRTREEKTVHVDAGDIIPRSEYTATNNTPM
jgi:hypothetical protein